MKLTQYILYNRYNAFQYLYFCILKKKMVDKEILIERERIKKIVKRRIKGLLVTRRAEKISRKRKHVIPISWIVSLPDNINFLIDNPDYVRTKDRNKENG